MARRRSFSNMKDLTESLKKLKWMVLSFCFAAIAFIVFSAIRQEMTLR